MDATAVMTRDAKPLAANDFGYVDPLDEDQPADDVVVTTRRAIGRVALVASETAARFQREGVSHDALSWMFAPRALFSGASAIDACLDRDACLRGVLMHGLSLGMDAAPEAIDALAADDDGEAFDALGGDVGGDDADLDSAPSMPRLFTATIVAEDGIETVHAFHASLATDEAEIAGRLYCRMGGAMADARIVEGFDSSEPLVEALVSRAIAEILALVAADPASPLALGVDVNIEQRFLTPPG